MLGLTQEHFIHYGTPIGLVAFIGLMIFIAWALARRSGAGRFGTFVLFFVLAFGMTGFLAKGVLQLIFGI